MSPLAIVGQRPGAPPGGRSDARAHPEAGRSQLVNLAHAAAVDRARDRMGDAATHHGSSWVGWGDVPDGRGRDHAL
jgi:hypothetical protein